MQQDAVGAHVATAGGRARAGSRGRSGAVGVDEARRRARAPASRTAAAGTGEVVDVVERVVQAEDVDARLGRAQDEAAHEVVGGGPRRRPGTCRAAPSRAACACAPRDGADALPGALDAALDGAS